MFRCMTCGQSARRRLADLRSGARVFPGPANWHLRLDEFGLRTDGKSESLPASETRRASREATVVGDQVASEVAC